MFTTALASAAEYLSELAVAIALATAAVVLVERQWLRYQARRTERVSRKYASAIQRAIAGDHDSRLALGRAPRSERFVIARLIITPLIDDRDPDRIATAREVI